MCILSDASIWNLLDIISDVETNSRSVLLLASFSFARRRPHFFVPVCIHVHVRSKLSHEALSPFSRIKHSSVVKSLTVSE